MRKTDPDYIFCVVLALLVSGCIFSLVVVVANLIIKSYFTN